jgi:hypothetical protein
MGEAANLSMKRAVARPLNRHEDPQVKGVLSLTVGRGEARVRGPPVVAQERGRLALRKPTDGWSGQWRPVNWSVSMRSNLNTD